VHIYKFVSFCYCRIVGGFVLGEYLEKVGRLVGKTTTHTVTVKLFSERVGRNDYLQIEHEGRNFLFMIKEIWTENSTTIARCSVVGSMPKTPFKPESIVFKASSELVRNVLGLSVSYEEGVYVGKLRGSPYKVFLPIKRLGRIFITGKTGSGKSYTVGVLIEEFLKKGIPVVIIDRHGEYSSLKIPAENGSEEFNVEPRSYEDRIIEFADLNVNPGGDIPVEAVLTTDAKDLVVSGQCTIINLRGLSTDMQQLIGEEILTKLYKASTSGNIPPFYCILDEAHLFAGKAKSPIREVVRLFAQEGRKFGANIIFLTQKPQLLDTTIRAQAGTWIIHQLTDYTDISVTVRSAEGLNEDWSEDIQRLEPGEAVIAGDAVRRVPLIVKIRPRETRHGAIGFNPLDYVSPETREELEKRRERLRAQFAMQVQEAKTRLEALKSGVEVLSITDAKRIIVKLEEDLKKKIEEAEVLKFRVKTLEKENAELREKYRKAVKTAEEAIKEAKKYERIVENLKRKII